MSEQIYIVNPLTKDPTPVKPVSFSDIGIRERDDLEKWVVNHPAVLGEPLLVITSEFDKFDRSNRRLDILALDRECNLVVVELKLDAERSLADLQAVRYAAFCSTITADDMVTMHASFVGCSEEEAADAIRLFLEQEEIAELSDRPRIIIAAGSMDDQELTSSVLWLRSFGVDITCVELTPYVTPTNSEIVLVPKTIIPIPEARDYIVSVEKKQAVQARQARDESKNSAFWRALADEFNGLGLEFHTWAGAKGSYMKVAVGSSKVHYEWIFRIRDSVVDVAIHFESDDRAENLKFLDLLEPHKDSITRGVDLGFDLSPWGHRWAVCRFRLPFLGLRPEPELAPRAAETMKILIERTWPILKPHIHTV